MDVRASSRLIVIIMIRLSFIREKSEDEKHQFAKQTMHSLSIYANPPWISTLIPRNGIEHELSRAKRDQINIYVKPQIHVMPTTYFN